MTKKKLSEMTLEELWQLFPIVLTEHRDCWDDWYEEEAQLLRSLVPDDARISHIGSTAIQGIWAKPIVDILVELSPDTSMEETCARLSAADYTCMSTEENRISFNKGYTEDGFVERVFHIHVRYLGDNDEMYFCRYLNEHPVTAKEYETLKLSLWKKYEHDRNGYTEAKGSFIREVTKKAKAEYSEL